MNERRSFFARLAAVALGLGIWRTAIEPESESPITLDEFRDIAGEIAQELLISDQETRDSELVRLKRETPALHALVVDRILDIRAAVLEAKHLLGQPRFIGKTFELESTTTYAAREAYILELFSK